MTKFFKKSYFCAILSPFCPNLGKNEFSWKKGLCQFLDIPIIYHRAKNQKKILSHFWEKRLTDGRTGGQTDELTDDDFIEPYVGRRSNKDDVYLSMSFLSTLLSSTNLQH